jgi:hypothetical protein
MIVPVSGDFPNAVTRLPGMNPVVLIGPITVDGSF